MAPPCAAALLRAKLVSCISRVVLGPAANSTTEAAEICCRREYAICRSKMNCDILNEWSLHQKRYYV